MVIVSTADDKYVLPLVVTFYSALANLTDIKAVSLYVLDGGVSDENKRKLAEVLKIKSVDVGLTWIRPDSASFYGVRLGEFPPNAYFRLLIPELLPEGIERAIYLDSDLVVEKDLQALDEESMGSHLALAVQDYMLPYASSGTEKLGLSETYQTLGLSPEAPYCNAGVMVMNLKEWRDKEIGTKALAFCRRFNRFDQDGLNAIITNNCGLLDPRWNVMLSDWSGNPFDAETARGMSRRVMARYAEHRPMSADEFQNAKETLFQDAFILHYASFPKPWHFFYRGFARDRWFHYLQKSGWFGVARDMGSLKACAWGAQNEHELWLKPLYAISRDLGALIPVQDSFILVDDGDFEPGLFEDRRSIPFMENNGEYSGSPPDDATAIREFERLRKSGASFIVFGWPAFWWLDHYRDFAHHLQSSYRCILKNERAVVFDLRTAN